MRNRAGKPAAEPDNDNIMKKGLPVIVTGGPFFLAARLICDRKEYVL